MNGQALIILERRKLYNCSLTFLDEFDAKIAPQKKIKYTPQASISFKINLFIRTTYLQPLSTSNLDETDINVMLLAKFLC